MKLQAHNVPLNRQSRRQKNNQKSWALKFYILLYMLVTVTVICGVANYRIDLNRKINELYRSSQGLQREIHNLDCDIKALKVEKQRLSSWDNISKKIALYKMPFRASNYQQVRYFTVRNNRDGQIQRNELYGKGAVNQLSQATY